MRDAAHAETAYEIAVGEVRDRYPAGSARKGDGIQSLRL